jgi:autotransporter-associated beta strand protein
LQIGNGGSTGSLSTSSAITNNGTLVFNRSNTITQGTNFASVIAGTGNVIKDGSGTLVLSGANTYTGATTISLGTLTVSGGSAIADTGAVSVESGAVLNLGASETIGSLAGAGNIALGANTLTTGRDNSSTTLSGVISGASGALTKDGTGTLTLTGVNTRSGMLTINAGTVNVTGTGTLGANSASVTLADVAGATLDFTGISASRQIGALAGGGSSGGNIVLGGFTTYFGAGLAGNSTYGGIISGTGTISYSGTGTQTLTGNNTFDGKTGISSGVLSISSISSVGGGASSVGNATSAATGRLDIGSTTTTGTLLYTGSGHSTDRVVNLAGASGGGTLDASGSGALVFTSGFTATVAGAKTLTLTGNNTADNRIGGAIVNSSNGSTSLTKDGTGKWILSGANTYNGNTTVSAGTLQIGNGGSTGSLSTSSAITNNGTLVFNRSNTITQGTDFSSVISGTGNVTQSGSGTLVLSGANTYTGATTVSQGTLIVSGSLSSSTVTIVAAGAVISFTGSSSAGDITIGAGASLALGTAGTAGAVTINAGTFTGAGTVSSLTFTGVSVFAPGNSPGTVTIADGGTLTMSVDTVSNFDITDPLFGSGTYDLVKGTAGGSLESVSFSGTLNLNFSGTGYSVTAMELKLFDVDSYSGAFSSVNVTGLDPGLVAAFDSSTGYVAIAAIPEPSAYAAVAGLGMVGFALYRRRRES